MKLIGYAGGNRMLIEATEDEIAMACGYSSIHDRGWKAARSAYSVDREDRVRIGSVFNVAEAQNYIRDMAGKEKKLEEVAGFLRSLADMVTHARPSLIIAPPEAPQEPAGTSAGGA